MNWHCQPYRSWKDRYTRWVWSCGGMEGVQEKLSRKYAQRTRAEVDHTPVPFSFLAVPSTFHVFAYL
jgi:hypothetical protein